MMSCQFGSELAAALKVISCESINMTATSEEHVIPGNCAVCHSKVKLRSHALNPNIHQGKDAAYMKRDAVVDEISRRISRARPRLAQQENGTPFGIRPARVRIVPI